MRVVYSRLLILISATSNDAVPLPVEAVAP
jgi:hypothetical protein